MSRSEDYLDNLLTSVTDKLNEFDDDFEQNRESLKESYQTQNDLPGKTQSALDEIREENFLREFEDELNKGHSHDDDFLAEFERELNGEAEDAFASPQAERYVNQMEEIVDHAGQKDDEFPLEIDNMDTVRQEDALDADLEDLFRNDSLDDVTDSLQTMQQEQIPDQTDTDAAQTSYPDFMQDTEMDDGTAAAVSKDEAAAASDTPEADIGEDVFSQMANEQDKSLEAPKGMEGLEDIFGDILGDDTDSLLNELENGTAQSSDESSTQQDEPILDDRLKEILDGSDEEALSEIDQLLDADTAGGGQDTQQAEDPLGLGPDFSYDEASLDGDEEGKKKKKEKNKNGMFGKISRLLFGTPAELDPEAAAEYEAAKAAMGQKEETDPKVLKEKKKQEKELKKQQKKEEAEKKKQEKAAAKAEKAAQKASKPKKEKKPKVKNQAPKEPPLPKVPVMMMWILAFSVMLLVFLGTSLVGYSAPVSASKEAFEKGDYVTAYTKLQGIKVREADEELLQASSALAGIQSEMDAYTSLMEQKQYEMALDALVRGYGRCVLNSAKAEEWGVSSQLKQMEDQFDQLLKEQFDVSKRKAKKLYNIKKRSEYTLALHEILDGLGLEHSSH